MYIPHCYDQYACGDLPITADLSLVAAFLDQIDIPDQVAYKPAGQQRMSLDFRSLGSRNRYSVFFLTPCYNINRDVPSS